MPQGIALPAGVWRFKPDQAPKDERTFSVPTAGADAGSIWGTFEKKSNETLGVYYRDPNPPHSIFQVFAGPPMNFKLAQPGTDYTGTVTAVP